MNRCAEKKPGSFFHLFDVITRVHVHNTGRENEPSCRGPISIGTRFAHTDSN